ncbi:MAG TPA: sterol-binding protein [Gammaproteobacteria bacterium]
MRAAERLLARCIAESTPARRLVAELEGAALTVIVEGLSLAVVLASDGGRVTLALTGAGAPELPEAAAARRRALLRAAPLDLLRLVRAGDLAALKRTRAELTGGVDVAERYVALLAHARPDLEEELARWIGDLAAHDLGSLARGAAGWVARAHRALLTDAAEYLQEERRALPAPAEARAFLADVERLRDDVERAAERLRRLAARHGA